MPLPMRPHPNTPTRLMSVMTLRTCGCRLASGRCPGAHEGADLIGQARERIHARPGEGVLRADLAALQAVEHLLQPDLYLLVLTPMGAERCHRRRSHGRRRRRLETSANRCTWQKPVSSGVTWAVTSAARASAKRRPPAPSARWIDAKAPTLGSHEIRSG